MEISQSFVAFSEFMNFKRNNSIYVLINLQKTAWKTKCWHLIENQKQSFINIFTNRLPNIGLISNIIKRIAVKIQNQNFYKLIGMTSFHIHLEPRRHSKPQLNFLVVNYLKSQVTSKKYVHIRAVGFRGGGAPGG